MNRAARVLAVAAVAVGMSAGMFHATAAYGRSVTVKGSDTMVILGQRWAEAYMRLNPGVSIEVTGGGSGVGIAALINGTIDIAEASRPMWGTEKEQVRLKRKAPAVEFPVALDTLAVYVNEKNPVEELSIEQLRRIFTGAARNWREMGGQDEVILLYGRENSSGTYVYFKEHVLENADFSPATRTLPGTAAVIDAVARDPRGIGYGGIAYGKGIKHLRVGKDENSAAVEPSLENVQKNAYPISRYLFWYTAGAPKDQIRKLIDWVMTPEGQALAASVGYYPLHAEVLARYSPAGGRSEKKK